MFREKKLGVGWGLCRIFAGLSTKMCTPFVARQKSFCQQKNLTHFCAGIQAYGREIRGFVTCCGNRA